MKQLKIILRPGKYKYTIILKGNKMLGYRMTEKQEDELLAELRENILNRYHSSEYWDGDIIHVFAQENNLQKEVNCQNCRKLGGNTCQGFGIESGCFEE